MAPIAYVEYAHWLRRAGAYLIDSVVLAIGMGIVLIPALVAAGGPGRGPALTAWLYFLVAPLAYFAGWHGSSGRTLGKQALGIRVVDVRSREPIGYVRALVRHATATILWLLFTVPGIVDALWPLMNDRRQALHDIVARSVVIDERLTLKHEAPVGSAT